VISVFIILQLAVGGCGIATWSSPEGGVRHSSSGVSVDDWSNQGGIGGSKWETYRIGSGRSQPGEQTGAGAATEAAASGVDTFTPNTRA
jgi:hypothetical protein